MLSSLLETRLSRYAIAAGAVVAAIPTQAAPITVILPTPIDVRSAFFDLNIDGVDDPELIFSGLGSSLAGLNPSGPIALGASGTMLRQLLTGVEFFSSGGSSFYNFLSEYSLALNTSTSPTFLAVAFATTSAGYQRLAFLQFEGPLLYGYAWEAGASSLTTFDLRGSASDVPEPATGALAALALGALAVAARKRKQA